MAEERIKSAMLHFFDLSPGDLHAQLAAWKWPKFRGDQLRRWVYEKLVDQPDAMSNLGKSERAQLASNIYFSGAEAVTRQDSSDGTRKLLLSWPGGANAETVMIPDADRRTACVSSQVGCPAGCRFCASGINGLQGNLTAGQIVEQIFALNKQLEDSRRRITNIVFMGMGEPLANYANVMRAVRILHDPQCFNIGARKITISTVGVPAKMRQLAGEDLPLNLAISLHAPNEKLRRELIPWAEHFALSDILAAARYYFQRTGREVTLEYILLSGVNDQPEHARELSRLCQTLRANVNLIRYNEVHSLPFRRPNSEDVVNFQAILRNSGVNAHVRKSRGRDIDAACGQLRRKQLQVPPAASIAPGPGTPLTVLSPGGANKPAFTLAELIVVIVMLAILVSIFIPYMMKIREDSRRTSCRNNLQEIFAALQHYARDNGSYFPSVPNDPNDPARQTAFTGADDRNPFAPGSAVKSNDVTASLWLLVRGGYIKDTGVFICPSVAAQRDLVHDPTGRAVKPTDRGNFRRSDNLSYSYASPFSAAPEYKLTETLPAEFALMADRNPGVVPGVPFGAPARDHLKINSKNHGGAGQNVLYAYGAVVFQWTPYCAMGNDNIYTVQGRIPSSTAATSQASQPSTTPGIVGNSIGPATPGDSYLLPVETDAP
jgi:23S rRNA (adenine2503-C2)-methyltransferase